MGKAAFFDVERVQFEKSLTFVKALQSLKAGHAFLDNYNTLREKFKSAQNIMDSINLLQVQLGIDDQRTLYAISKWHQRQNILGESTTISALPEYVNLCKEAKKSEKIRDSSKTHLMTVHGSKGLEFDEVFIIGAVQGIFPNGDNLEEERRLFYVAITRAKEYLNISRPLNIMGYNGDMATTKQSQFVAEFLN